MEQPDDEEEKCRCLRQCREEIDQTVLNWKRVKNIHNDNGYSFISPNNIQFETTIEIKDFLLAMIGSSLGLDYLIEKLKCLPLSDLTQGRNNQEEIGFSGTSDKIRDVDFVTSKYFPNKLSPQSTKINVQNTSKVHLSNPSVHEECIFKDNSNITHDKSEKVLCKYNVISSINDVIVQNSNETDHTATTLQILNSKLEKILDEKIHETCKTKSCSSNKENKKLENCDANSVYSSAHDNVTREKRKKEKQRLEKDFNVMMEHREKTVTDKCENLEECQCNHKLILDNYIGAAEENSDKEHICRSVDNCHHRRDEQHSSKQNIRVYGKPLFSDRTNVKEQATSFRQLERLDIQNVEENEVNNSNNSFPDDNVDEIVTVENSSRSVVKDVIDGNIPNDFSCQQRILHRAISNGYSSDGGDAHEGNDKGNTNISSPVYNYSFSHFTEQSSQEQRQMPSLEPCTIHYIPSSVDYISIEHVPETPRKSEMKKKSENDTHNKNAESNDINSLPTTSSNNTDSVILKNNNNEDDNDAIISFNDIEILDSHSKYNGKSNTNNNVNFTTSTIINTNNFGKGINNNNNNTTTNSIFILNEVDGNMNSSNDNVSVDNSNNNSIHNDTNAIDKNLDLNQFNAIDSNSSDRESLDNNETHNIDDNGDNINNNTKDFHAGASKYQAESVKAKKNINSQINKDEKNVGVENPEKSKKLQEYKKTNSSETEGLKNENCCVEVSGNCDGFKRENQIKLKDNQAKRINTNTMIISQDEHRTENNKQILVEKCNSDMCTESADENMDIKKGGFKEACTTNYSEGRTIQQCNKETLTLTAKRVQKTEKEELQHEKNILDCEAREEDEAGFRKLDKNEILQLDKDEKHTYIGEKSTVMIGNYEADKSPKSEVVPNVEEIKSENGVKTIEPTTSEEVGIVSKCEKVDSIVQTELAKTNSNNNNNTGTNESTIIDTADFVKYTKFDNINSRECNKTGDNNKNRHTDDNNKSFQFENGSNNKELECDQDLVNELEKVFVTRQKGTDKNQEHVKKEIVSDANNTEICSTHEIDTKIQIANKDARSVQENVIKNEKIRTVDISTHDRQIDLQNKNFIQSRSHNSNDDKPKPFILEEHRKLDTALDIESELPINSDVLTRLSQEDSDYYINLNTVNDINSGIKTTVKDETKNQNTVISEKRIEKCTDRREGTDTAKRKCNLEGNVKERDDYTIDTKHEEVCERRRERFSKYSRIESHDVSHNLQQPQRQRPNNKDVIKIHNVRDINLEQPSTKVFESRKHYRVHFIYALTPRRVYQNVTSINNRMEMTDKRKGNKRKCGDVKLKDKEKQKRNETPKEHDTVKNKRKIAVTKSKKTENVQNSIRYKSNNAEDDSETKIDSQNEKISNEKLVALKSEEKHAKQKSSRLKTNAARSEDRIKKLTNAGNKRVTMNLAAGKHDSLHKKLKLSPYFQPSKINIKERLQNIKEVCNQKNGRLVKKPVPTNKCRGLHETITYMPPKSPHNLIQEELYDKPWQLLVATIFLNRTTGQAAVPVFWNFVKKYPTPEKLLKADRQEIADIMQPLGLHNRRAENIFKFSDEYLNKNWKYPIELYGIGKYGNDAYQMFCCGQWKEVEPNDHMLNRYHKWITEQDRMGLLD